MITIQDIAKLKDSKTVPVHIIARGMGLTPQGLRVKIKNNSQPNVDQLTTLKLALKNFKAKKQNEFETLLNELEWND